MKYFNGNQMPKRGSYVILIIRVYNLFYRYEVLYVRSTSYFDIDAYWFSIKENLLAWYYVKDPDKLAEQIIADRKKKFELKLNKWEEEANEKRETEKKERPEDLPSECSEDQSP